jgi:bacterioferritin-associated ferredoxin
MYVCICHSITEKDIKKASKNGAKTIQDLKYMTGCATGCGGCLDYAVELLEKNQSSRISDFLNIYPGNNNPVIQN